MNFIRTEKQRHSQAVVARQAAFALMHAKQERVLARKIAAEFARETAEVVENIRKYSGQKSNIPAVDRWIFDTIKGRMYFNETLTDEAWKAFRLSGWRTFSELRISPDDFIVGTMAAEAHITGHAAAVAAQVIDTQVNLFGRVLEDTFLAGQSEDELIASAKRVGNFAKRWRSVMISRTETTGALNFGDTEAAKQTGLIWGNEWVASLDAVTRPDHVAVNGKTAALGEDFPIVNIEYPGDPSGELSTIINCRCFLLKIEK